MKRALLAVVALLSVSPNVSAQSTAETISRALAAAPARAREDATVIEWNADHTYETLQEGSNRWVCYDRSGDPGRRPFAVQCTSVANLERVAQSRRFDAETESVDELRAMVAAAEVDGTRVPPEYGSVFISMNGADRDSARKHTTIAVPGATTESTGFSEDSSNGGVWLMNAGTTTAHLMTPGP